MRSNDGEPRESANGGSRYRLIEICGRGGFATVWRAADEKLGRKIAVKRLSERLARDPQARRRFIHEARLTSRLEHPGIVPIYDLLEDSSEAEPQYAMKLVRGITLAEAIERYHTLSTEGSNRSVELLSLLNSYLAVAHTMEFAHARGVLHRDLKPQNILLGEFGETIVLDWGLAKSLQDATKEIAGPRVTTAESPFVTQPGTVQGTPAYMAPEQAAGRTDEVDERTDVYALGAILYELLSGRIPFGGRTSEDVQQRVIDEEPVSPRVVNAHVSRPMAAICLKAMGKSPSVRYPSVRALREDLERAIADEPITVYRESLWERGTRWMRGHRAAAMALAATLGVTCLVLLAALIVISDSRGRETVARQDADRQRDERASRQVSRMNV